MYMNIYIYMLLCIYTYICVYIYMCTSTYDQCPDTSYRRLDRKPPEMRLTSSLNVRVLAVKAALKREIEVLTKGFGNDRSIGQHG